MRPCRMETPLEIRMLGHLRTEVRRRRQKDILKVSHTHTHSPTRTVFFLSLSLDFFATLLSSHAFFLKRPRHSTTIIFRSSPSPFSVSACIACVYATRSRLWLLSCCCVFYAFWSWFYEIHPRGWGLDVGLFSTIIVKCHTEGESLHSYAWSDSLCGRCLVAMSTEVSIDINCKHAKGEQYRGAFLPLVPHTHIYMHVFLFSLMAPSSWKSNVRTHTAFNYSSSHLSFFKYIYNHCFHHDEYQLFLLLKRKSK